MIIAAIKEGAHAEAYVNGFKVEIFSESTLLDELVDFTYYFKHLKNRVELQNLADSKNVGRRICAMMCIGRWNFTSGCRTILDGVG